MAINAVTSTRAQLENVYVVAQRGTRFHLPTTIEEQIWRSSPGQPKQLAKGKGHPTPTPTSSQPSPSAKPKAQPKKKGGKGGGKGKKDKPSVKSSAKSSAKAGEVSFDNDDAEEEEEHDAEYDWDETEEYVAEEEQEDTFAEFAFATAYHSHVCEVCDPDDGEFVAPMGDSETHGESQEIVPLEGTGPRMRMR